MPIASDVLEKLSANDPSLVKLNLSYQNLILRDIEVLITALQTNTYLTELDITGNLIGDKGAILLATIANLTSLNAECIRASNSGAIALASHRKLKNLNLSQNMLGDEAAKAFATNFVLKSLNLGGTQLTDSGACLFAQNDTLTSLNLTETLITDEGVVALAQNRALISLRLTGNQLGDKSAIALAGHPALTTLALCYNNVSPEGAKVLAQNTRLRSLNLNYNVVGVAGAIALSANTTLAELYLASNKLNHMGIKALLQNQTLSLLDLNYNQIDDESSDAFRENHSLTELNLSYNFVSQRTARALAEHPTLRKLAISHNLLGDEGAVALAQNKHITWLDLTDNQIGPIGAQALAHNQILITLILSTNAVADIGAVSLSSNTTLRELMLCYNHVGDAGAIALAQNRTLQKINLNYNQIREKGRESLQQNVSFQKFLLSIEQPPPFTAENLNTIFYLSQDYLVIKSENDTIQFFNPAFSRALGYLDEELLGTSFIELLHPEDRLEEINRMKFGSHKFPLAEQFSRCQCKDDSYRTIRWTSQMRHQRIYAVGVDVTLQQQIAAKMKRMEQTNILVTAHAEASEAASQERGNFIAHLCHEARNPLSGIVGNLEIIKEHLNTLSQQQRQATPAAQPAIEETMTKVMECVADMGTCAAHQSSIFNDNLDLSKLAENKLHLESKPFKINIILQEAYRMLKALVDKKGLVLTIHSPENDIVIKGDPARIKQMILNIANNAIKFTHQGKIDIALLVTQQTSSYTAFELRVTDTGIGLDEDEQKQLFKRFSQINSSAGNEYGGSGLGLFIVKNIAKLMNGDITLESKKGQGSTFHCYFQCENPSELEILELERDLQEKQDILKKFPTGSSAFFKPEQLSKKQNQSIKILIVDDNEINRKILGFNLSKEGFECIFAVDGRDALEKHARHSTNLILMDIVMPDMDGLEATREIRRLERDNKVPRVPIIALTGNALESQRQIALDSGMDDYLAKPYKREILLEKIVMYLNPKGGAEKQSTTAQDISPRM